MSGAFAVLGWVVTAVIVVGVSVGWYVIGGVELERDKHGYVRLGEQTRVELPAGDVRLNFAPAFEAVGGPSHGNTELPRPSNLKVSVRRGRGAEPLQVTELPRWLQWDYFWADKRVYGKVEVPEAGRYLVSVTSDPGRGRIAIGERPWTPFDSPLAGAAIVFVLLAAIARFARSLIDLLF